MVNAERIEHLTIKVVCGTLPTKFDNFDLLHAHCNTLITSIFYDNYRS